MKLLTRSTLSTIATALATVASLTAPALMGAPTAAAQAQTYIVKNLGVLPGHTSSRALDVNDLGQVVGQSIKDATSTTPSSFRAFLWTPGGTAGSASNPQMQDLGTVNGEDMYASKINNAGQVILRGGTLGYLWDAANGIRNMNDPAVSNAATLGWTRVSPLDINESGTVTGAYTAVDGTRRAFLWMPTTPNGSYGTLSDMGQPTGFKIPASSNTINNVGQVTGNMTPLAGGATHLYLWNPIDPVTGAFSPNATTGVYTDLGVLSATSTAATSINDRGEIAGIFTASGGSGRGFARDTAGGITVMNPLNMTLLRSEARGINNASQVVGSSSDRAFMWTVSSGIRDLNALIVGGDSKGFTVQWAYAINNASVNGAGKAQIVGQGLVTKVGNRAFLLTPQ